MQFILRTCTRCSPRTPQPEVARVLLRRGTWGPPLVLEEARLVEHIPVNGEVDQAFAVIVPSTEG